MAAPKAGGNNLNNRSVGASRKLADDDDDFADTDISSMLG